MAFDGIAVSVIVAELDQHLKNGRIMKIYQIDKNTLVLHLRLLGTTTQLVISADPAHPRIHSTAKDFVNPLAPPAFCMLLRKHLEPGRIIAIEQYELERVLKIRFETYDPETGPGEKALIFELIGRQSNIILVDQHKIIVDAIYRISNETADRIIIPGEPYRLPDTQGKVNPYTQDEDQFFDNLRLLPANLTLTQGLMQLYQGLGPDAAREILNHAHLDPDQTKHETSLEQLNQLYTGWTSFITQIGQPVLAKPRRKLDFFAYPLTHIEPVKSYDSFDNLLDEFFTQRIEQEAIRQKANALQRVLKTQLKRVQKKETIQRDTLKNAANAHDLQKQGEIILANLHLIVKGQATLVAADFYEQEQPLIKIQLDPLLKPVENAQAYFKKYAKAKKSEKVTARQLRNTVLERKYIAETLFHIETADSTDTLSEIEEEIRTTGYLPRKKRKTKSQQISNLGYEEFISSDGLPILLGRNNRQNDMLTFKVARAEDIWFHAQNIPGSHVVIRTNNQAEIPVKTIQEAATLAAYHSKAKTSPKVPVDYTRRKHVRKPKGAKPGFVMYQEFDSIMVDPTEQENLPLKK